MITRIKALWADIRFAVMGDRAHEIAIRDRVAEGLGAEVRRLNKALDDQRASHEFTKHLLHTQAEEHAPMRRRLLEAERLAVGLRRANDRLVIENERLRAEFDDRTAAHLARTEGLLSALAQVRDLFPEPPEGSRRIAWEEAVSEPTSVPAFVEGEVEHLRKELRETADELRQEHERRYTGDES